MPNPETNRLRVVMVPFFPGNPYQILLCDALNSSGVTAKGIALSEVRHLRQLIKEKQIDIIHLHWLTYLFMTHKNILRVIYRAIRFCLMILQARLSKIKIVWTLHNIENHEKRLVWLDYLVSLFISRLADELICHSHTGKKSFMQHFRIPANKPFHVIPHAHYKSFYPNDVTPSSARERLGVASNTFVFLFFGLIRPYKGVLKLLNAYAEFKQKNKEKTLLYICGKPLQEAYYAEVQKKAAAIPSVLLSPTVADEEIQFYMNAADVVVLPYLNVLTSGATLLALTFSKPVITPNLGDATEILNAETSFLYDPDSPDGLLECLHQAYQNRDHLSRMGEAAYQSIQNNTAEFAAKKTKAVYQHVLSEGQAL